MSARCRIPPENSCGYCLARSAAFGSPAAARVSTTLRSTSLRVASPCARSVSAICVPIFATGLRFDIGSCGTRPIERPRMPRITLSGAPTRSSPSKRMLPCVTWPLPGSSPITAMAVVDLPEPDSPTIASVSPAARSRSTPSTACTMPSTVRNSTATSRTCSRGVPAATRSEDRAILPSCPGAHAGAPAGASLYALVTPGSPSGRAALPRAHFESRAPRSAARSRRGCRPVGGRTERQHAPSHGATVEHGLDRPERRPRRDGRGRADGRRRGDVRGDLERERRLRRARGGCRIDARSGRPGRAVRGRRRRASVLSRSGELRAASRWRWRRTSSRASVAAQLCRARRCRRATCATSSRTARCTTRSRSTREQADAVVAAIADARRAARARRCRARPARRDRARRARAPGCRFVREAFLDRGYLPDGIARPARRARRAAARPGGGRRPRGPPRPRGRRRGRRRLARARWTRHPSASTATRPTRSRWRGRCARRSTPRASRCGRHGDRTAPRILPMGERAILLEVGLARRGARAARAGSRHPARTASSTSCPRRGRCSCASTRRCCRSRRRGRGSPRRRRMPHPSHLRERRPSSSRSSTTAPTSPRPPRCSG